MTTNMFDEISYSQMEKLYKDRFKDAGDFTFFIVGNIEEDIAKEMAAKYIGNLKDDPREENWIDRNVRSPRGKTLKKIEVPLQTEKATVNVAIKKDMKYTPESNLNLNILREILRLRYTEEVREKEGGTYGVSVGTSFSKFPFESKTLRMSFDTDPEKAEHLKSIIFREIEKIAKKGPTGVDLEKVILNLKKEREQAKPHNAYWMNVIYNYYYLGENNDAKENFEDIIEQISPKKIKKFTKSFMKKADIIDVVFVPKKSE